MPPWRRTCRRRRRSAITVRIGSAGQHVAQAVGDGRDDLRVPRLPSSAPGCAVDAPEATAGTPSIINPAATESSTASTRNELAVPRSWMAAPPTEDTGHLGHVLADALQRDAGHQPLRRHQRRHHGLHGRGPTSARPSQIIRASTATPATPTTPAPTSTPVATSTTAPAEAADGHQAAPVVAVAEHAGGQRQERHRQADARSP